jgi:hypothetical protein
MRQSSYLQISSSIVSKRFFNFDPLVVVEISWMPVPCQHSLEREDEGMGGNLYRKEFHAKRFLLSGLE